MTSVRCGGRLVALLAGLLCFSAELSVESSAPERTSALELAKLQGTWVMVSMEIKSRKIPDARIQRYQLSIKEDVWKVNTSGRDTATYKLRLDPTVSPKQIDFLPMSGGEAVSRGVYELKGDMLTVCRTVGEKDRPTEFKTSEAVGILVVWKRTSR